MVIAHVQTPGCHVHHFLVAFRGPSKSRKNLPVGNMQWRRYERNSATTSQKIAAPAWPRHGQQRQNYQSPKANGGVKVSFNPDDEGNIQPRGHRGQISYKTFTRPCSRVYESRRIKNCCWNEAERYQPQKLDAQRLQIKKLQSINKSTMVFSKFVHFLRKFCNFFIKLLQRSINNTIYKSKFMLSALE